MQDWLQFDRSWVRNNSPVDFENGFIEVYRDARGAKAASESFVSITGAKLSNAMLKIAANAEYFEDRAPWLAEYRKQGVTPPIAMAVESVVEAGILRVGVGGKNLPNEDEIREQIGTKNFFLMSNVRALEGVRGASALEDASSPAEIARYRKYGGTAGELYVSLHEVIGHASGKVSRRLAQSPEAYLKEYYSALEEARASLVAYWNIFDPKLKELGLVDSDEVGRAMYDNAAHAMLAVLSRVPRGDTIEEDHARGSLLTARYIMDRTGAIALERHGNKTYAVVKDYEKMHTGVGMLLAN